MQKVLEQLQTERNILTEAWYILKKYVGIEQKDYDQPAVQQEWEELVESCKKLYYTSGTAAQMKLANSISMALMDYYSELSKPTERGN